MSVVNKAPNSTCAEITIAVPRLATFSGSLAGIVADHQRHEAERDLEDQQADDAARDTLDASDLTELAGRERGRDRRHHEDHECVADVRPQRPLVVGVSGQCADHRLRDEREQHDRDDRAAASGRTVLDGRRRGRYRREF
jgi:hypothetical protein